MRFPHLTELSFAVSSLDDVEGGRVLNLLLWGCEDLRSLVLDNESLPWRRRSFEREALLAELLEPIATFVLTGSL